MSKSSDKRSRAVCIRAYELSQEGFTHRQIAELILCRPEQVAAKINRGKLASIRDGRERHADQG